MKLGEEIKRKVGQKEVNTRWKKYQDKSCKEWDWTPSDSVWLATTTNSEYDKFKKGNINRINISDLIRNEYNSNLF